MMTNIDSEINCVGNIATAALLFVFKFYVYYLSENYVTVPYFKDSSIMDLFYQILLFKIKGSKSVKTDAILFFYEKSLLR